MTIDLLLNLLTLICLVIVSSAWIWGVHGAFITTGLAETWFFGSWPNIMRRPVFDCPSCMSTLHVPLVYFAVGALDLLPLYFIGLVWIMTAGLNFVIKEYLYPEQE